MSEKIEIFVRVLRGEVISKPKKWEAAVAFLVFRAEGTNEPTESSNPAVLLGFVDKVVGLFELMIRLDLNARIERFDDAASRECWEIAYKRMEALRSSAHKICALALRMDFEQKLRRHLWVRGVPMFE